MRLVRSLALLTVLALVAAGQMRTETVSAQTTTSVSRLVVADAVTGVLTVYDAADGRPLAVFSTPSANPGVVASPGGRWVYAINTAANRVTILDSGLQLVDHGDHKDLLIGPAYVRGTVNTGRRPIDFWAQNGEATVHNDDDGTLAVFDEERLEFALDYAEIRGAGTGHNNAVVLGDTVLLSLASAGRITAYRMDNSVVTSFENCPGTHGWTVRGDTAAAGCADGVMLITRTDAGLRSGKVAEPLGSPENARVGTLTSHPASSVMVGNFGQGLALVRPDAETLQVVPLPSNPVRFLFDQSGARLVVLTLDGTVHLLQPDTGRVLASVAAVTAMRTGEGAPPTAAMAVGAASTYITDPQAGVIVELALDQLRVTRRWTTGGTPRNIALVTATGVVE